tara:strand:- start:3805 stop:4170 length:366 start_codon:yes stop_codon:yes gene_type:complete
MEGDSKLIYMILAIIVVIVVAIIVFRCYYTTEEERDAHMNNLYVGIAVGILGVVVISYLYCNSDVSMSEQEYGIRSSVRNWWNEKSDVNRAGRRAGAEAKEQARSRAKREMRERKYEERGY